LGNRRWREEPGEAPGSLPFYYVFHHGKREKKGQEPGEALESLPFSRVQHGKEPKGGKELGDVPN